MPRYIALDAFRGLTIAAMILVNLPGSRAYTYAPLLHAHWHGWTLADLVFPFFLFIIGSAMYFSLHSQKHDSSKVVVYRIFKRGIILFIIGFMINAMSLFAEPISQLRIMGVLQRIAIVYIFASLTVYFLGPRSLIAAVFFLSLSYWLLLVSTDGTGIENNIVRQFDLAILGSSHMWRIDGIAFDPEGLLSTLPAIVNVLIGFEITRFLVAQQDKIRSLKKIALLGLLLAAIGLIWDQFLPINKPLWTSSYAIFTSGVATLLLAVFIWIADVQKIEWLGKPFVIYGQNSLFIYVLSMIWPIIFSHVVAVTGSNGSSVSGYEWLYAKLLIGFNPANASLAFALLHVLLFWLIAYALYRKNVLIKI